ncbi:hypothetical protein [Quadrisphaera sp. KR29]|uniref:hypothetical protein n=1 Tax=Quadrisphaera sp. KR29 TaxID=3461391 RepID=UPI004043F2FA
MTTSGSGPVPAPRRPLPQPRPLLDQLALLAQAVDVLAVRVAVSGDVASGVRARALGLHVATTAAAVREQVARQRDVIAPVLSAADGGAGAELLAASLASADRVLAQVEGTGAGASALLSQTAGVAALQRLGVSTRALWSALVDHERLWAAGAAPLARRLLTERAQRTTCG